MRPACQNGVIMKAINLPRICNEQGIILNGYDYDKQAWVRDGLYVRCGHPETMCCDCYGRKHAGEKSTYAA